MEKELSTGMQILITMVLLSVLIGVIIAIVMYSSEVTEQESVKLNTASAGFTSSQWSRYDQVKLTGVEVQAAVEMFMNTDATIVVSKRNGVSYSNFCYGRGLRNIGHPATNSSITAEVQDSQCSSPSAVSNMFLGNKTANMRDSTHTGFVRGSAPFMAKLIVDSGNTTVGIMFVSQ